MPWRELRPWFIQQWDQGQHIAIIGPSGQGKTTVAIDLLEARADERDGHVLILANKRRDPLLTKLGWPIVPDWDSVHYEHRVRRRVVIWPPYGRASSSAARNRKVFVEALDEVIEEGAWTVYLDEVTYFTETLNLRKLLDEYWNTARSSAVTVIGSSQGATWIPKAMTTNQSWVFCFKSRDEEVRKRVGEVAGDRRAYAPILGNLGQHEFLLVNTITGEGFVSKVGT